MSTLWHLKMEMLILVVRNKKRKKKEVLVQIFCIHHEWHNWTVFGPLLKLDDDQCVSV